MPILNSLGALKELLPATGGMSQNYWIDITPSTAMSTATFDPLGKFRFVTNTNKFATLTDKNATVNISLVSGTISANTVQRITGTSNNEVLIGFHNSVSVPKIVGVSVITNGNTPAGGFGFTSTTRGLALGNITIDTNNNYILCGQGDGDANISSYGLLAKYDASKALQWQKAVRMPPKVTIPQYDFNITVADAVSDGANVYATGFYVSTDGSVRGGVVFKTDSSGTLLWTTNLGYDGKVISLIDNNANIVVGGTGSVGVSKGYVTKFSGGGGGLFGIAINNGTYANTTTQVTALNVDATNNIVVGGQYVNTSGLPRPLNGYVIGLTTNFALRYSKDIHLVTTGAPQMSITSLGQDPNQALYISGLNSVGGSAYTGLLFKTLYDGTTIGTGNYVISGVNVSYLDNTKLNITNAYGGGSSNLFLSTGITGSTGITTILSNTTQTINKLFL